MPAYGYQRRVVNDEYGLLELREVSFDLSPDGLRRLAAFLRDCADRAEAGDLRSDHVHIEEFDREWNRQSPDLDVIVLSHWVGPIAKRPSETRVKEPPQ